MAKKRQEDPPKGLAPWMATFSDLMNLLLCFFVLLFSMSTVDAEKFAELAASLSSSFSVLPNGASAIGDGMLVSNGVSQLNELAEYVNNMGYEAEEQIQDDAIEEVKQQQLEETEQIAEVIEALAGKNNIDKQLDVDFNGQYVSLTLNGALLFDSGSAEIKEEAKPIMDKVAMILTKYRDHTIEIEGHTDNVPIHTARFQDNNELSSFRALSVFNYLLEVSELDPAILKHSGRGEYVPVADNSTPEGRMRNRRVEIKIYSNLLDN
ncbi:MAG: flagellar motor protein MotB [Lachnospiraceae bacterium]|nr:flagellar motor protein MotB [Lachnospiraceae bacterium]